jgi:hypothetical protein
VVLALVGFVLSLVVHAWVMPHTSGNADEVVYRFQAEMYRSGLATLVDDGPVFRPWMSGVVDGERLMVFPAGWPAVLALGGALTQSYAVTVALLVAALGPAIWWFVHELTADRRAAWVGAATTLVCPLVIVHSGTLLSYVPALVLEAVFAASVLRALRRGRLRPLVAGGAALGVLFAMRPLDAGLMAVPFGGLLLWTWRADVRRAIVAAGWGLAGAALPVVAVLAYNARVTGSPITFPIEAAGGNNAFGFGPRNIAEGTPVLDVGPGRLATATLKNLTELPQWLPGVWVGVPLIVVGAVLLWRRARPAAVALAVLAVLFPLAYLFYWGTYLLSRGRHDFGPFYYAGIWLPAAACVGTGAVWVWERIGSRAGPRRLAVVGGGAVVVAATTVVVLHGPLTTFDQYTARAEQQLALVEDLPDDSLVVLPVAYDGPWILFPWNQYANRPALDGPVVYAADAGPATLDALERFEDRTAFSLLAPQGPGNGGPLALEPLAVLRDEWFEVEVQVRDVAPAATRAYLLVGGGGAQCAVEPSPSGGALVVRWRTDGRRVEAVSGCAGPEEAALPAPAGQRDCVAGVQGGEGPGRVLREERFWCRGPSDGEPMTLAVPGEPRVGAELDGARPSWSTEPRHDAEQRVRVRIEAEDGRAPSPTAP